MYTSSSFCVKILDKIIWYIRKITKSLFDTHILKRTGKGKVRRSEEDSSDSKGCVVSKEVGTPGRRNTGRVRRFFMLDNKLV